MAFLVAVGAAELGGWTLTFQAKEAVRSALDGRGGWRGAARGCRRRPDLLAPGPQSPRPVHGLPGPLFNAKHLDKGGC